MAGQMVSRGSAEIETEAAEAPPAVNLKRRARLMVALVLLLILMGVNLAIGSGKLQLERVVSESMEPTLLVGDVLLIDRNALARVNDIVVLEDPEDASQKLVKRLVATAGARVVVEDGVLFVDGREQNSRHVSENQLHWRDVRVDVPLGRMFVLGDNRNNSVDSLNFGPVPTSNLHGVLLAVVWPPSRWRLASATR